MLMLVAETVG
jgi:hypothetical protein